MPTTSKKKASALPIMNKGGGVQGPCCLPVLRGKKTDTNRALLPLQHTAPHKHHEQWPNRAANLPTMAPHSLGTTMLPTGRAGGWVERGGQAVHIKNTGSIIKSYQMSGRHSASNGKDFWFPLLTAHTHCSSDGLQLRGAQG